MDKNLILFIDVQLNERETIKYINVGIVYDLNTNPFISLQ